jgi:hypothetical protein
LTDDPELLLPLDWAEADLEPVVVVFALLDPIKFML